MKRYVMMILRGIGVLAIVGLLCFVYMILTNEQGQVEKMQMIFIKTQDDADCTLILNRDKVIMIDTGEEKDYSHIQDILKQHQINRIDCLILTHPDKDHIGSALQIVQNYKVSLVMEPYYVKENKRYEDLNQYIKDNNIAHMILSRKRDFVYGDMRLRVYPPDEFDYKSENNYSLAVQIKHHNVNMFFAGDAMKKRTEELMALPLEKANLYKMSYHGRDYEGSYELLNKIQPQNIIVTSNHLGKDLAKQVSSHQYNFYYTLMGDVYVNSDGQQVTIWQ